MFYTFYILVNFFFTPWLFATRLPPELKILNMFNIGSFASIFSQGCVSFSLKNHGERVTENLKEKIYRWQKYYLIYLLK